MNLQIESLLGIGYQYKKGKEENKKYTEVEDELKNIFYTYFSKDLVDQKFKIPLEYQEFLNEMESSMVLNKRNVIYDATYLIKGTKVFLEDFEDFYFQRKQGKRTPLSTDTLWIRIGWWSDRHDWVICCDQEHLMYGKVYDVWDDHPWLHENFATYSQHKNFAEFVIHLLETSEA